MLEVTLQSIKWEIRQKFEVGLQEIYETVRYSHFDCKI